MLVTDFMADALSFDHEMRSGDDQTRADRLRLLFGFSF
jgi:hypothetical protein